MKCFFCVGLIFRRIVFFLFSEAFLLSTNVAFFALDLTLFCGKYTDYRLVTKYFTFFFA